MTPSSHAPDQEVATLTERRLLWAEREVARADRRALDAEQKLEQAQAAQRKAEEDRRAETDRVNNLTAQLQMLYSSTSWKVSRPVRAVSKARRVVQRLLGKVEAPAAKPPTPPPPIEPAVVLEAREQAILNRLLGRP